ncbi:hypothetical protein [Kordia jejudonensis]|uniref:hypothetical protein n=1 Tax=Kordia jejudonensis TaxID=1348245 RepID=UPI0006294152|nr:hypothetical protein [Kordia jejudonensis]
MKYFSIICMLLVIVGCQPKVRKDKNLIEDILILEVPYEKQIKVLEELGYKLNDSIREEDIFGQLRELIDYGHKLSNNKVKTFVEENPYQDLYFTLGWTKYDKTSKKFITFTDKCIWYDLEFIDPTSSEYITLMKRMGKITNGELQFEDIEYTVDTDNNEWIKFKVNGIKKEWKLLQVGYIDDSFFTRFLYLTQEFNTKGRYTYFDNGSQQFVIDYATPSEQKEFNEKTGLQRQWLTEGKHFSIPKDE